MLVEPFVGMLAEKLRAGIEESLSRDAGNDGKHHLHAAAAAAEPQAS